MNITTKYTTTGTGAGRIVATGGGRQKTVPYDHSVSPARNHGAAAGELAKVIISKELGPLADEKERNSAFRRASERATHVDHGDKHVFTI